MKMIEGACSLLDKNVTPQKKPFVRPSNHEEFILQHFDAANRTTLQTALTLP